MFDPETPPEFRVTRWLNTAQPPTLAALKGRVVVLVAFQMLCPGCVEHGLPQARRLRERFSDSQVAVIGLHTVFEHHDVMTPAALDVFVREYRWPFPIGIDEPGDGPVPRTMAAYQMQGTPSLLVFDRAGRLRRHYFGRPDDIMLAAEIMALSIEDAGAPREQAAMIERKIAATLTAPAHDHGAGGDGHDHAHHHHDGCGPSCGHDHHDHDGHHGHHHANSPSAGRGPTGREVEANEFTVPLDHGRPKG